MGHNIIFKFIFICLFVSISTKPFDNGDASSGTNFVSGRDVISRRVKRIVEGFKDYSADDEDDDATTSLSTTKDHNFTTTAEFIDMAENFMDDLNGEALLGNGFITVKKRSVKESLEKGYSENEKRSASDNHMNMEDRKTVNETAEYMYSGFPESLPNNSNINYSKLSSAHSDARFKRRTVKKDLTHDQIFKPRDNPIPENKHKESLESFNNFSITSPSHTSTSKFSDIALNNEVDAMTNILYDSMLNDINKESTNLSRAMNLSTGFSKDVQDSDEGHEIWSRVNLESLFELPNDTVQATRDHSGARVDSSNGNLNDNQKLKVHFKDALDAIPTLIMDNVTLDSSASTDSFFFDVESSSTSEDSNLTIEHGILQMKRRKPKSRMDILNMLVMKLPVLICDIVLWIACYKLLKHIITQLALKDAVMAKFRSRETVVVDYGRYNPRTSLDMVEPAKVQGGLFGARDDKFGTKDGGDEV